MTHVGALPDRLQFSIGRALSNSFGVLSRNFKTMAVISVTVAVVESAIRYFLADSIDGGVSGDTALTLISYALVTTPITYMTFQDMRGRRASFGEAMSAGLQKLVRVIGVTLVVGLTIIVPVAVGGLVLLSTGMIAPQELIAVGFPYVGRSWDWCWFSSSCSSSSPWPSS
jgi:hypothetical protein